MQTAVQDAALTQESERLRDREVRWSSLPARLAECKAQIDRQHAMGLEQLKSTYEKKEAALATLRI